MLKFKCSDNANSRAVSYTHLDVYKRQALYRARSKHSMPDSRYAYFVNLWSFVQVWLRTHKSARFIKPNILQVLVKKLILFCISKELNTSFGRPAELSSLRPTDSKKTSQCYQPRSKLGDPTRTLNGHHKVEWETVVCSHPMWILSSCRHTRVWLSLTHTRARARVRAHTHFPVSCLNLRKYYLNLVQSLVKKLTDNKTTLF